MPPPPPLPPPPPKLDAVSDDGEDKAEADDGDRRPTDAELPDTADATDETDTFGPEPAWDDVAFEVVLDVEAPEPDDPTAATPVEALVLAVLPMECVGSWVERTRRTLISAR
jgi:hypothetical protein